MLTLTDVRYVPATHRDAQRLTADLSDVDRAHAAAVIPNMDLEGAVWNLVRFATEAVSVVTKDTNRLVAIYGYRRPSALSRVVTPWVLMTQWGRDRASRTAALRLARRVVGDLTAAGFVLRTVTPADDKVIRRWLRSVGFSEERERCAIISGEPLIELEAR